MSLGKGGRTSSGKLPRLPSGKSGRHTDSSASCCPGDPDPGSPCGSCANGTPSTIKLVTTGILQTFSRTINASGTWCLSQVPLEPCKWKVRYNYACLTMSINGVEQPIVGVEAVVSITTPGYWDVIIQGVDQYNVAHAIRMASVAIPSGNCLTQVSGTFAGGGSFVVTPNAACTHTYDTCTDTASHSDPCDCKPSTNPKIRLTFDVPILAGCQLWNDGTNDWAWKVGDSVTYFTASYELDSGGNGLMDETWNLLHDYQNNACSGDWGEDSDYLAVGVVWDCEKIEVSVVVHSATIGLFVLFYGYAPVTESMMESCNGVVLVNNPGAWQNHPYAGFTRGPDMQDPEINSGGECAVAWVAT